VDWAVQITYALGGRLLQRELPLRIYGLLAGELEMALLRAHDRRWLADHEIPADHITDVRAWITPSRDHTRPRQ
jgi:hypothetical protein